MAEEERDGVRLTSLDQPLGDDLGVTKGDLVDYLDAVADRMVPLLAGRPLSVKRVRPGQPPFMQRNVSKGAPDWVRTVPVWSEGSHREIAPGALRRPAHAAVAGQPARRRVPRALLPRRGVASRPAWCSTSTRPRARTSRSSSAPPGWSGRRSRTPGLTRRREDQRVEGRARRRPGAGRAVRGRRGRHPRARRPHRAPRPRARHDRLHQGGPARPGLRRLDPVGPDHDRGRLQPPDPARPARCPPRSAGTRWTTCRPRTSP